MEGANLAARHEEAETLDFPLELDAGRFENLPTHFFAEIFEIVARSLPHVDHEVAVKRRHLSAADDEAAAVRLVDQLPRGMTLGILEGRTTGLFTNRLHRLAVIAHRIHFGADLRAIIRIAFEQHRGEDQII